MRVAGARGLEQMRFTGEQWSGKGEICKTVYNEKLGEQKESFLTVSLLYHFYASASAFTAWSGLFRTESWIRCVGSQFYPWFLLGHWVGLQKNRWSASREWVNEVIEGIKGDHLSSERKGKSSQPRGALKKSGLWSLRRLNESWVTSLTLTTTMKSSMPPRESATAVPRKADFWLTQRAIALF